MCKDGDLGQLQHLQVRFLRMQEKPMDPRRQSWIDARYREEVQCNLEVWTPEREVAALWRCVRVVGTLIPPQVAGDPSACAQPSVCKHASTTKRAQPSRHIIIIVKCCPLNAATGIWRVACARCPLRIVQRNAGRTGRCWAHRKLSTS